LSKDVLITGISGFVGTHLLNYLISNDSLSITGVSRNKEKISYLDSKIHRTCSFEEVYSGEYSFDTYVHLSGKVYNIRDKSDESEYYEANYEATKRLFDCFKHDKQAKKFIFLSTIHVLTESPDQILDESYNPEPFTPYGKSKYEAEQHIQNECPEEKKFYILRPSMIHGPGNKGNLNLLYNLVKSGLPYPFGVYNNKRSFVSVDNLCFVLREFIQNDIKKGLYHIADDDPTYTHELVELIAEITNRKKRIWNVPLPILNFFAKMGNTIPLPLNEHRFNKLTGDFIVSNKKLKKAIGKDLPVSSKEGLKKTLKNIEPDK
jgi:nucleoside-diphosphate-sugar epimerase